MARVRETCPAQLQARDVRQRGRGPHAALLNRQADLGADVPTGCVDRGLTPSVVTVGVPLVNHEAIIQVLTFGDDIAPATLALPREAAPRVDAVIVDIVTAEARVLRVLAITSSTAKPEDIIRHIA